MSANGHAGGEPVGFAVSRFDTAFPKGPAVGTMTCTTWADFTRLLRHRRQGAKDGPNFIPAIFRRDPSGGVRRLKENVVSRTAIVLDVETSKQTGEVPPSFTEAVARIEALGWAAGAYTSHSHSPSAPRYRIVVPLSDPIAPELPAPEVVAELLNLRGVLDTGKIAAASLFYLPSAEPGKLALHEAAVLEGEPIDAAWMTARAGAILAEREAERQRQRDIAQEIAAKRREDKLRTGFDSDSSIIEAVRSRLDLHGELVGHGYRPAGDNRYLFHGSETGVPGVFTLTGRDGVERVYSHHAADPLAAGNLPSWCQANAVDVVDVVTILDHGGDQKAALRSLAARFGINARKPSARAAAPRPNGVDDHGTLHGHAKGQDPGQQARKRAKPCKADTDDDPPLTEDGLARAFAAQHAQHLRYCHDTGTWFLWNGFIWRPERTRLAFTWAREAARSMLRQVAANYPLELKFSRAAVAAAVERFAQADRAFAVTSETWDADPWLLGTPAGTVDLRTGQLKPAVITDFITKATAVAPAETPDCPRWLQFLDEACGGDAGFTRFLRQWCGYTLTGSIQEHALLFIHGDGGNGKSVWLNTVSNILGDYCRTAAMDAFTASQHNRHPTDLASLQGARMVCASETEEGKAWSELRIKQLTGGDRIAARFMRQDFFEYSPQFKLTVVGNHMPELHNVDDAARRRFNMAPLTHKPPKVDKQLGEKLREEWPGILRWMIEGCLDWQMHGLVRPGVVTASTLAYFGNQDLLAQWIGERCKPLGYGNTEASRLFASWREWAIAAGEDPGSQKRFSNALTSRGYVKVRSGIGRAAFTGIALDDVRPHYAEPDHERD